MTNEEHLTELGITNPKLQELAIERMPPGFHSVEQIQRCGAHNCSTAQMLDLNLWIGIRQGLAAAQSVMDHEIESVRKEIKHKRTLK